MIGDGFQGGKNRGQREAFDKGRMMDDDCQTTRHSGIYVMARLFTMEDRIRDGVETCGYESLPHTKILTLHLRPGVDNCQIQARSHRLHDTSLPLTTLFSPHEYIVLHRRDAWDVAHIWHMDDFSTDVSRRTVW